jgi:hypothetical protein
LEVAVQSGDPKGAPHFGSGGADDAEPATVRAELPPRATSTPTASTPLNALATTHTQGKRAIRVA